MTGNPSHLKSLAESTEVQTSVFRGLKRASTSKSTWAGSTLLQTGERSGQASFARVEQVLQ